MSARRIALASLLASLTALVLALGAAAAVDSGSSLRISFLPQKTFRGTAATLVATVRPTGVRCTGSVVYADGRRQAIGTVVAKRGRAAWKWLVPADAKLGAATVTVACKRAGTASRVITVVGPPTEPARVDVEKQGFSQRVKYGNREVSYGIVLANASGDKDALGVAVHVNFLDATNTVLKTAVTTVPVVGAKAQYFLGGYVSIPEGIPVSTLEIVVKIGSQEPAALRVPELSDYRWLQSPYDPGWVSTVLFQALNDEPILSFSSPSISVVLFDAAGNVLGGGTGYGMTPLAPGIRAQFDASSGLTAIPYDRVASASVSMLGTYTRVT